MTVAMSNVQTPPSPPPAPEAQERDYTELVIQPRRGWIAVDWSELWRARELLYFLVWRDVKVRYKQTVLGVAWAILQPLFTTLIFTFLGRAGGFSEALPDPRLFPVFVFAALVPWQFFSNAVSLGSLSLLNQQHMITKVYFPRLFIPTGNVGGALVDMGITTVLMIGMCLYYGVLPSWQVIFLPLLIALTVLCVLGVTYALAALTVAYRDFRFLVPFMLQMWMWLSALFYAPSEFGKWEPISYLNPMIGIITSFRAAVLGLEWNFPALGASIVISLALCVFGIFYFRKTERRFADIA
jgi:lipopolysaccharide transport system permease protein